ncbi:hypothetical protein DSTSK_26870 [Desulforhabdus sp. TSK]|nr:hypothetical protein DSTSK_26870 [Desulforhabdus sp. TSK]
MAERQRRVPDSRGLLRPMLLTQPTFVIPAKAGIQENKDFLDPGFHRGDVSQHHWLLRPGSSVGGQDQPVPPCRGWVLQPISSKHSQPVIPACFKLE